MVRAAGDGGGRVLERRQRQTEVRRRRAAADCGRQQLGQGTRRHGELAFQADPPTVYLAKVKNLLVGLPPTSEEVAAVTAEPTQLKSLIQGWMRLPQYTTKMQRFFELAFQQTQVTSADYADQVYPKQIDVNGATTPLLLQNLQESFARTMLALIAAGQPLTAAATTNQLMMTTALKELYAFLDIWEVDDNGTVTDRFKKANPKLQITVETAAGPIPIAETLDPTSANYMHWYDPDAATEDSSIAGCAMDPIVYPPSAFTLHWLLYGALDGRKLADGTNCPQSGGSATAAQLTASDFTDWTLVTIRPPNTGEVPSTFYDLPALRSATTLVLSIPRVGFFSTPAFFANWQTNSSNQMRVTMNQTLIVALGASVDGTDPTMPPTDLPPGLDAVHAAGPGCAHCHLTLDPTRSIFAASYSWNYHDQLDTTWSGQPGEFIFQGVVQPVTSMADLGSTLAAHPCSRPPGSRSSATTRTRNPATPPIRSSSAWWRCSRPPSIRGTRWSPSCSRRRSPPTRRPPRRRPHTERSSPCRAGTTSARRSTIAWGSATSAASRRPRRSR